MATLPETEPTESADTGLACRAGDILKLADATRLALELAEIGARAADLAGGDPRLVRTLRKHIAGLRRGVGL